MSEKDAEAILRPAAEVKYANELKTLRTKDDAPRPPGWAMSARAVRAFILGDAKLGVSRKFYGDDPLVDRAIVSLMGQQGLMLVGEPGTAKSMLSELLAAAISDQSGLVVQGSAGTTDDHIRYSWNYALLLAEGPSEKALVPSPVLNAMRQAQIVRFEELTRCPPEVQDALVSVLSEKTVAVPELGIDWAIQARPGFNIIATANLRDRGVHEMSSALKRRFNFETVHPVSDPAFEKELISSQLAERLDSSDVAADVATDVLDVLVQSFQDLRTGRTADGVTLNKPDAVMSTAEAVNVLHSASLEASFLDASKVTGAHIARAMQGVVLKDNADDGKKFQAYVNHVAKARSRGHAQWKAFYQTARSLAK